MKILYSKTSIKYLQGLERKLVKKIVEAIDKLPSDGDIKRLKGKKIILDFVSHENFSQHNPSIIIE